MIGRMDEMSSDDYLLAAKSGREQPSEDDHQYVASHQAKTIKDGAAPDCGHDEV